MPFKVGMPNLGHTMETGRLAEWSVRVGDAVAAGQLIGAVETEKATFDIEAPGDGVLLAIYVEEGSEVPVGTILAIVGAQGEVLNEPAPAEVTAPAPAATVASPVGRVEPPRRRILASPAAKRLAEELGVDLALVEGTGEDGMISKEDVSQAASGKAQGAPLQMRRAIAEATARAWAEVPHVPLTAHADLSADIPRAKLTAAIVRAAALALRTHPDLNGWWTDGRFQPADAAHVGVVVAVPDGLMTVTVTGAEAKSVDEIAGEIADMAAAARAGTLKGAKTTGASFTVSSLGRWGIDSFAPVIAAPQVAILGVGGVGRAPREYRDGIRFVDELGLTLVFDHRANDGVAAAQCLADIVGRLQVPGLMGAGA